MKAISSSPDFSTSGDGQRDARFSCLEWGRWEGAKRAGRMKGGVSKKGEQADVRGLLMCHPDSSVGCNLVMQV